MTLADGDETGPCGWLKDRYGFSWQVCPDELAERAFDAMLTMGKIDIAAVRTAADGSARR